MNITHKTEQKPMMANAMRYKSFQDFNILCNRPDVGNPKDLYSSIKQNIEFSLSSHEKKGTKDQPSNRRLREETSFHLLHAINPQQEPVWHAMAG